MTDTKPIANSFQTPNTHVDRAMFYLTGDEYKVLNFATRHIIGWHYNLEKRAGIITRNVFENGFITEKGEHFLGCGLKKQAIDRILKTLVQYRLLKRVTNRSQSATTGQVWALGDSPDWKGLEQRWQQQQTVNHQRTQKARKKAHTNSINTILVGLSDRESLSDNYSLSDNDSVGLSDNLTESLSDNYSVGLSDNPHINTYINTESKTKVKTLSADADARNAQSSEIHSLAFKEPVETEPPVKVAKAKTAETEKTLSPSSAAPPLSLPAPEPQPVKNTTPATPPVISRPKPMMREVQFAIVEAMKHIGKWRADSIGDSQFSEAGKAAKKLVALPTPVYPEEVVSLVEYVHDLAEAEKWSSWKAYGLDGYVSDWRNAPGRKYVSKKQRQQQEAASPQPSCFRRSSPPVTEPEIPLPPDRPEGETAKTNDIGDISDLLFARLRDGKRHRARTATTQRGMGAMPS